MYRSTLALLLLLATGCQYGITDETLRAHDRVLAKNLSGAGAAAATGGYGYMLRIVDFPPIADAGLAEEARAVAAAWFGGDFPTNFDPTDERPDGMMTVAETEGALANFFAVHSPALTPLDHIDTIYTWVGGREYCVNCFTALQSDGFEWGFSYAGSDYKFTITAFKKVDI